MDSERSLGGIGLLGNEKYTGTYLFLTGKDFGTLG